MNEHHLKLLRLINDKVNTNQTINKNEIGFLLETIYVLLDNNDYLYQYYTEIQQINELNKFLKDKNISED